MNVFDIVKSKENSMAKLNIKIDTLVHAPLDYVWETWNTPSHIIHWNHASDDRHSPKADSNFVEGGRFVYRMEAKDNSFGFDFSGTFVEIVDKKRIVTRLDDDRIVQTEFIQENDGVRIIETFEAEDENSVEMQKEGWYAILNNYKLYTESKYI
jgi:uncharacterized protein YndB with AHSA1/START domain